MSLHYINLYNYSDVVTTSSFSSLGFLVENKKTDNIGYVTTPMKNVVFGSGISTLLSTQSSILNNYCNLDLLTQLDQKDYHYTRIILINYLYDLEHYLESTKQSSYDIKCYLWNDIEIDDWEELIVEIKTPYSSDKEFNQLLDKYIDILVESYNKYLKRVEISETQDELNSYNKINVILSNYDNSD